MLKMCRRGKRLDRAFYLKETLQVARALLGKYLIQDGSEGITVGKIVETEAYLGTEDPASHAYEGKKTERTEVQYKRGGHAYVYVIYGIHNCFNVVTGEQDEPESVFIRALEPIEGVELMKKRRDFEDLSKRELVELTNGPGKLCMAMNIDKDYSGKDLCGDELFIVEPSQEENFEVTSGKRINIDYAGEAKNWPWRFYIKGNDHVSRSD